MKKIKVRNIMVPLSEYATVYEDMTLFEAIVILENTKKKFDQNREQHKAILIQSRKTGKVIGKMSQLDVIRTLEPKYDLIGKEDALSRIGLSKFGFSFQFIKSMIDQYKLWDESLAAICRRAGQKPVSEIMYTPTEGEYVQAEATLGEAVHQLVMGNHQGLLVVDDEEIIGVLRLSDVFVEICRVMEEDHLK